MPTTTIAQAEAFLTKGAADEALALTAPLADALPSVDFLSVHAQALKALGRGDEALAWDRRAVAKFPQAAVAWHNLAATLGDLGQGAAAAEAAGRALALGLDAPQTWLVYARGLAAAGQSAEAAAAFRQAIARAPRDPTPPRELAELLWTSNADLDGAIAVLVEAGQAGAPPTPLILKVVSLLRTAGEADQALEHLAEAVRANPGDVALALALSDARLRGGDAPGARTALEAVRAAQPDNPAILCQISWTETALGRPAEALAHAERGLTAAPDAQPLLNALATAARACGDPRAAVLNDEALVLEAMIEPPAGWTDLAAYLADLAAAVGRLHTNRGHPTEQSLQGGSQTTFRLTGHPDLAIRAFFQAIDAPVRAYMARLGPGDDPVRRRNTGEYRIAGAWSVLLRPGDFHRDHIHSEGWLSSAFYIETPAAALERDNHEGWLRFGQPPFHLRTPQPVLRHVRPEPGKLALFPSYMWHGTEPFTTDERRMTIAFDLVPA